MEKRKQSFSVWTLAHLLEFSHYPEPRFPGLCWEVLAVFTPGFASASDPAWRLHRFQHLHPGDSTCFRVSILMVTSPLPSRKREKIKPLSLFCKSIYSSLPVSPWILLSNAISSSFKLLITSPLSSPLFFWSFCCLFLVCWSLSVCLPVWGIMCWFQRDVKF